VKVGHYNRCLHTKAKAVLADRLRHSYDDLFLADREAYSKSAGTLKGWFKTKTGAADKVAEKMATTFRSLAQYADFSAPPSVATERSQPKAVSEEPSPIETPIALPPAATTIPLAPAQASALGLVYRLEIHLPDTQNVDTFRAIFRALKEELIP
jgi:hypothetical protein